MYIVGQEQDLNIRKEKLLYNKEVKSFLTLTFGTRSLPFFCKNLIDEINNIPAQYISIDQTVDLNSEDYNEVVSRITYSIICDTDDDNIYFDGEKNVYIGDDNTIQELVYIEDLSQRSISSLEEQVTNTIPQEDLYNYSFYLDTFYLDTGIDNNKINGLLEKIGGVQQIRLSLGNKVNLSNNLHNKFISSYQYDDQFTIEQVNADSSGNIDEYVSMLKLELPYIKEVSVNRHVSSITFNMYLFEKIQNFYQIARKTLIK